MDSLAKIAEQRMREAMERGEFDNLPFHGQPIIPEDLSGIPEPLRMGYKVLKNAGILPPEMQLKKEILTLRHLLDACEDADEQQRMLTKMNEMVLRFNMMMERQQQTAVHRQYHTQIMKRLA